MHILFYSPVKLQSGGGCERWHCDITNSLKKQFRCSLEIVTADLGEDRWSPEYLNTQLQGIPYTQLTFLHFFGILIPTVKNFIFLYKKCKQADAVHFIYGFMGQDVFMAMLKFFTGVKIVVGHHAPIFHSSKIHNYYMKFVSRYILGYFDFHQTLNASDKTFFEKKWKIKNVYFIPSGIRVDRFLKLKRKRHDDITFLSVGRYAKQKGFDLAVEAIDLFNKKFPQNKAQFIFIGSGDMVNVIEKYAKRNNNIINAGFIAYENIPNYYENADIYLLTSREEPFGLVLIEAWAAGIPVLATKTEGPIDMLKEGVNGWFIKEISAVKIADAIEKIYQQALKNHSFLSSFEIECKKTGRYYSIDRTAQEMKKNFFMERSS